MTQIGHNDPFDYFPLYNGYQPFKMGLTKPTKWPNNLVFQFDDRFEDYRAVKLQNRKENYLYYATISFKLSQELKKEAIFKICSILSTEHSDLFKYYFVGGAYCLICKLTGEEIHFDTEGELLGVTNAEADYIDTFDAICMQLQEDVILHALDEDREYASTIHLHFGNEWGANLAIGRKLSTIHERVPSIDRVIPDHVKMIRGIINSKERMFERIAGVNFRTNSLLNLHPYMGVVNKVFDPDKGRLFIRIERQTIVPLMSNYVSGGFMFTIKTYFCDVNEMTEEQLWCLLAAFEHPITDTNGFDFIQQNREAVVPWLKNKLNIPMQNNRIISNFSEFYNTQYKKLILAKSSDLDKDMADWCENMIWMQRNMWAKTNKGIMTHEVYNQLLERLEQIRPDSVYL